MGTARDIALIFLSLEALVVALVPLVIVGGLAYGVYRLTQLVRVYLQLAQGYAQKAHDYVERASAVVAEPFIRVHGTAKGATTIVERLTRR
ncbi:MAG: hypothetical protein JXC32_20265 [Anaerolineae bacterium]|nr:hypothetical protein [Anaerolineae bacterium]